MNHDLFMYLLISLNIIFIIIIISLKNDKGMKIIRRNMFKFSGIWQSEHFSYIFPILVRALTWPSPMVNVISFKYFNALCLTNKTIFTLWVRQQILYPLYLRKIFSQYGGFYSSELQNRCGTIDFLFIAALTEWKSIWLEKPINDVLKAATHQIIDLEWKGIEARRVVIRDVFKLSLSQDCLYCFNLCELRLEFQGSKSLYEFILISQILWNSMLRTKLICIYVNSQPCAFCVSLIKFVFSKIRIIV